MKTVKDAIDVFNELSRDDRLAFYITAGSQLRDSSGTVEEFLLETRHCDGLRCAHCESLHFVKNGRRKDGTQRYLCRDCGRSFLATTDSILSGTQKDLSVWRRYLRCMMERKTLKESAVTCGISIGTAFHWRHKILDSLQGASGAVRLSGVVEADETYTPLSFKGNHRKSSGFCMPRPAHKRGNDSHKKGLSHELVCIPCAVDRSGVPVSAVGKTGKVSSHCIERVFSGRLHDDAVLCTDHEQAYLRFSAEQQLRLIRMDTDGHTRGAYGIQRINAYHSKLKGFLRHWNGVSTKYLPNYLVWHGLMFCSGKNRRELEELLFGTVLSEKIRIRCREISGRPPVPTTV